MNPLLKNVPKLTQEQELALLDRYRNGDSEAGGTLVHAHAPWIRNIISKVPVPSWVSQEDLFCDVMPEVLAALKTYRSENGSALKTYLYVAIHRASVKCARIYEGNPGIDSMEIEAPEPGESGVVAAIHGLVASIPDDEINETGRKLISRMLKGYDDEEIASQMGWGVAETVSVVKHMRLYLAYIMVIVGHSAEPYISDVTLTSMAEEYERQRDSWFV